MVSVHSLLRSRPSMPKDARSAVDPKALLLVLGTGWVFSCDTFFHVFPTMLVKQYETILIFPINGWYKPSKYVWFMIALLTLITFHYHILPWGEDHSVSISLFFNTKSTLEYVGGVQVPMVPWRCWDVLQNWMVVTGGQCWSLVFDMGLSENRVYPQL